METIRNTIFLVDDNVTNLAIGKNTLIGKYNVFTIPSGEKMLKMLEKTTPDLILLDIEMPEMNGYDVIRILKADEKTSSIPVIFLTAKNDSTSELEGLSLGAIDYIVKPFSPPLLLKRIEVHLLVESQKTELQNYNDNLQHMVKEKTGTVVELQNAILRTFADLVEYRDDVTGGHIERTQYYIKILIDALVENGLCTHEVSQWNLELMLQSSQLHDVGKIAIKDNILSKPGKLTDEEFEQMKKHTTFGVKIIEKMEQYTTERAFLEYAKIFAGTHHERWDGSGYPNGLAGGDIPLPGRLMAIADVYDALISERPYKKALTHSESTEIITSGGGTQFDPELAGLFARVSDKFQQSAALKV